jgi:prolycopene isomerase
LQHCSIRFRRFIDIQLQTLAQCSSADSGFDRAIVALNPYRAFWTIKGGAQSLAGILATSFKESGGTLRLNAPVLRLAYGSDGTPVGVDLLSGERVTATRAIVSNLTVWDTYGKLIGSNRTPRAISGELKKLRGWGAYLLFASLDESGASRLPLPRILALTDWRDNQAYDPEQQFVFSAAPATEGRAPDGKLAVTISTYTRGEDWFSFHEDHEAHETQDQSMLESLWLRVHAALPELADSIEIIDSATPQTFYETTRRKFGMVGGVCLSPRALATPFANVFLVGDTVAKGAGIDAVAGTGYTAAHLILSNNRQ